MSDPLSDPEIRCDRAPAARDRVRSVRSRPAKAERERRVVEGLKGGVAMAEIARREGISERGMRKYVKNLFARRAPEATGEFIATQMNRLNEALLVSFGAMSPENLPAVDRVVRIVRELDRYQGFGGGARGTATRRKLLESLNSGAETGPCPTRAALDLARAEALAEDESAEDDLRDPLADLLPDPTALADRLSRGARERNPQAGAATPSSSRATPGSKSPGGGDPEAAGPNDRRLPSPHVLTVGAAAPGLLRFARNDDSERADSAVVRGTGMRRNPLESLNSGAGTAPVAFAEEDGDGAAAQNYADLMS